MESLIDGNHMLLEGRQGNGAIIGYGSLIHPDEIEAEFEDFNPVSIPVRLNGYKRLFNNRSLWRDPTKAVLNVEAASERWCNAIVILLQDTARPEDYEEREGGYHFERVAVDQLHPYISSHQTVLDEIDWIEVPIGDRVESDIEPLLSYVKRCLEGAKWWSQQLEGSTDPEFGSFLEDFINTTELADKTPFSDYLNQNNQSIEAIDW